MPDVSSLPSSERAKAIEDLASTINNQRIAFGFRKVDPDARGQEILKSVAKAMTCLPEYTIRVEGHSNLAKSEEKLTDQDRDRIQKLSEGRANACAEILKAAGVHNEISCVGLGALKGESKGCVRLVLCKTSIAPQAHVDQPAVYQAEANLPQVEADKPCSTDAIVEDAFAAQTTNKQVLTESPGPEDFSKPSDAGETDGFAKSDPATEPLLVAGLADADLNVAEPASSATISPKEHTSNDFVIVVEQKEEPKEALNVGGDPAPAPSQFGAWVNTHLPWTMNPWYIACCTEAKAHVDECPMQGLTVKQLHTLH